MDGKDVSHRIAFAPGGAPQVVRLAQEGDIGGIVHGEDRLDPEIARRFAGSERVEHRFEACRTFGIGHPPAIVQFTCRGVEHLCGIGKDPQASLPCAARSNRARAFSSPISGSNSPMSGP